MSITLNLDDPAELLLRQIARDMNLSVEDVLMAALNQYADHMATRRNRFSFIGIGHSQTTDLSEPVDEYLEKGANRNEGWSLG